MKRLISRISKGRGWVIKPPTKINGIVNAIRKGKL